MDSILYFEKWPSFMTMFIHLSLWGLSIPKALHIDVWETAGVTAMAAGGEQT